MIGGGGGPLLPMNTNLHPLNQPSKQQALGQLTQNFFQHN